MCLARKTEGLLKKQSIVLAIIENVNLGKICC
jgi:hypothetical protein